MPVLIIDDDEELCELLTDYLGNEGFVVETVNNGEAGLARLGPMNPSLVVLDVMMPGMNGFEVLRRIREISTVPILMLTARGDDVDRIVGLEMGADDYLPKPFNPRELVARLRAIRRRVVIATGPGDPSAPMRLGEVELDPALRVARREGEVLPLTSVEFALLEVLMRAAGRALNRDELAEQVLGRPWSPYDRSIDVHVSNLRRKLAQGGRPELIKTVRGVGYQYAERKGA